MAIWSWPFLGTIAVHTGEVVALVVREGRVISRSQDKTIVVSDIVTRQQEATLDTHPHFVAALAVSGPMLLGSGASSTIGMWALGTWSHLRMGRVSDHVPDAVLCSCLAIRGSKLLCGGECRDQESDFLVVFDSDSMDFQHTAARRFRRKLAVRVARHCRLRSKFADKHRELPVKTTHDSKSADTTRHESFMVGREPVHASEA